MIAAPVTISPEGLVFRVVEAYSTTTKDSVRGWVNHAPTMIGWNRHGCPIAKIYPGNMGPNLRACFGNVIAWEDLVTK